MTVVIKASTLCLLIALSVVPFPYSEAQAKDLGVRGQTWEIMEVDLLVFMQAKAAEFAKSGQLEKWQKNAKARARSYVETPTPVTGIIHAQSESQRLYDPSIRVRHDILDHQGRLIAKRGTKINPLDYLSLTTELLFVDGNDKSQMQWALNIEGKTKIILVDGPVGTLMRQHKRALYFDQKGILSTQFQINAVPTSITQQERKLLIREFPISNGGKR